MTRYVAFLRGINLGRRRLKMDRMKELFDDLGFEDVSTFIASGNVIFDSDEMDSAGLEARIESHLKSKLGYEVDTYIRTIDELAAIVSADLFPPSANDVPEQTVFVTFLDQPPEKASIETLIALQTDGDQFAFRDREFYWLRRGRLTDSTVDMKALGRAMKGDPGTMRNITTLRKVLAKYGR